MALNTTYAGHTFAKTVGGILISGSSETASAVTAEAKAQALDDILQEYFQSRGAPYDDSDIGITDVRKAIIYARGKKHTKAVRKGVIGATKFGLQVAATAGGATIGSIIPIAGTALGGLGGAIGGASLGVGVSALDQLKRKAKGFYKFVRHTRGKHREQAAQTLMHCSSDQFDRADGQNVACLALHVILQEEYDSVMARHDTERVADRLKSN